MAQLPIIHSGAPEYSWVDRLRAMREAYEAARERTPERATSDEALLDAWLVFHSLRLKGTPVRLEEVEAARADYPAEVVPAIAGALAAVARVRVAAAAGEELTPGLLLELNGLVDPETGGRLRAGPPLAVYQGHESPGPEALDRLIENAAGWFTAESFTGEFHPVEQAALALVRICDLQPFPSNNEMTARIGATLFTLRAGWPPIIVREEFEAEYRKAILHAIHLDTHLLVELLARCVARAYDDLLNWNIHALVDE
jgi:hypothetical protein